MPSAPRTTLVELADPELEWKRFERFSLDLVRALPDVADAHLYGTRGEVQGGIDIHAELTNGRVRTIQCRRVGRFTKTDARRTIHETTYEADEHRVWCTAAMTAGARDLLRAKPGWDGWDIEQISSAIRALPREDARWLVQDHLGSAARQRFLGPDAELAVVPARRWFATRDDDATWTPTNQPLLGRDAELAQLRAAMADATTRVVILPGRPGIGKTRLLRAVSEVQADDRVLLLRPGVDASVTLAEELPAAPFTLLADDAQRRGDLATVLAIALAAPARTVILATRPQYVPTLRETLAAGGVDAHAILELPRLASLDEESGAALAEHQLGGAGPMTERLGRWTRDVPALCVLGARLVKQDQLDPARLSGTEQARAEILTRFRDELVGNVSQAADQSLVRRLLETVALLQPFELHAPRSRVWLAEFLPCTANALEDAARALAAAGLLEATGPVYRIVPDLLADFLVEDVCTRTGAPTGAAERFAEAVDDADRPRLLANLAELDWRLSEAGRPTVLDGILATTRRELAAADAWDREEGLKELERAAPYLAEWIVGLARDLLDRPAATAEVGFGHFTGDASARGALVPLLQSAALDRRATHAALALLWEIARDGTQRPVFGAVEPIKAAANFGNYELSIIYADALLDVVEQLLADPADAEAHTELPVRLLSEMTCREGTRSRWRSHAIELTGYFVSARATQPLRTRLRELLVGCCLTGGDRTRPAAAALLGDMLRQPHGYFGNPVPSGALSQWRDEQMLLLADVEDILGRTDDPNVAMRLRDEVEWHAAHSAIRGVRTLAREVLRAHPPGDDEILLRLLTGSIDRLADYAEGERRFRRSALRVERTSPSPADLLGRVDAAIEASRRADPEVHADPRQLLGLLAAADGEWAVSAARVLVDEPQRPSASATGAVLSEALAARADDVRGILAKLHASPDAALRRLASDHVARMRWVEDTDAPERDLAIELAADDDPLVVTHAVLAAHRLADHEPALARRVLLAIRSLNHPAIAEDVCMVLSHDLHLSEADEDVLLDRLVGCPQVDFWHDKFVVALARRRLGRVLRYFLGRLERGRDDYQYRPVPFDGLSADPVAEDDECEPALRELVAAAARDDSAGRPLALSTLFWSFAGGSDDAFHVLAEALAEEADSVREAARDLLAEAEPGVILTRPAWVAEQLTRVAPNELDDLQGALAVALTTGVKQGTPGQPFPEDVHLRDTAAAHATASRAGSRAASFWTAMVRSAENSIRESLDRDARVAANG